MSRIDIQAIRSRVEEATLGPWTKVHESNKDMVVRFFDFFGKQFEVVTGDIEALDADFIAHAREDIPALLDEVELLTEQLRRTREFHDCDGTCADELE